VTLAPSAVTRTLKARVPRGTRTWIRTSPALASYMNKVQVSSIGQTSD
jgi:hypothetical protein